MVLHTDPFEAVAPGFHHGNGKAKAPATPAASDQILVPYPPVDYGSAAQEQQMEDSELLRQPLELSQAFEAFLRERCGSQLRPFVILYLSRDGTIRTCVSTDLEQQREYIIQAESISIRRFAKLAGQNFVCGDADSEPVASEPSPQTASYGWPTVQPTQCSRRKRLVSRPVRSLQRVPSKKGKVAFPGLHKDKRPRSTTQSDDEDHGMEPNVSSANAHEEEDDEPWNEEDFTPTLRAFKIGDLDGWKTYFDYAFQEIQQLALKWMLKKWIKAIEPKKQTMFPYVASNPSKQAERQSARKRAKGGERMPKEPKTYINDGVPYWWPQGVTHKEPDHIAKKERIALAKHIIMMCGDLWASMLERAEQYRKDEGEMPTTNPWVELLMRSTIDTANLKTGKDSPEKRARRLRIFHDMYSMAKTFEEWRVGGINDDDVITYEDLSKNSKFKIPRESRRSSVQDSVGKHTVYNEDPDVVASATQSLQHGIAVSNLQPSQSYNATLSKQHPVEPRHATPISHGLPFVTNADLQPTPPAAQLTLNGPRRFSGIDVSQHRDVLQRVREDSFAGPQSPLPSSYFEPVNRDPMCLAAHQIQTAPVEWCASRNAHLEHSPQNEFQVHRFEPSHRPEFRDIRWHNPAVDRSIASTDNDRWHTSYPDSQYDPSSTSTSSMISPETPFPEAPHLPSARVGWNIPTSNASQPQASYLPIDQQMVFSAPGMMAHTSCLNKRF